MFYLEGRSGVPPYLQLVQQVKQALLLGQLRPGDRLPLIREVVASLALNPNTVAKAYRQLEHDGLVAGRPGSGTFITASAPSAVSPATYSKLRRSLERWVRETVDAGLDDDSRAALFATVQRQARVEGAA